MKLCHLHLVSPMGNKTTLICNLDEGSIRYTFYSGYGSSGMGNSLSNLQCDLPMDKVSPKETKEQFIQRIKDIINNKSVCRVVNEVKEVIF